MAEEQILKVSLKEYKQGIDELRASLLGLEKDSEEYKKVSQEVAEKQHKLNEVMSVGKKVTDAAEGSYNDLNQQLKFLRREYMALDEAARQSAEGINKLEAIKGLDEKLKGLDAEMGVFSRNVGNYKGAIEEAFKSGLKGLSSMDGEVGKIAGSLSGLFPIIKKVTTAAIAGLNGIKAAIAATGIGAIVVALGLILTHWQDIKEALVGVDEEMANIEKRTNDLNTKFERQLEVMGIMERLMKSRGASEKDIIKAKKRQYEIMIQEVKAELQLLKLDIERLNAHSSLWKIFHNYPEKAKEMEERLKGWQTKLKEFSKILTSLNIDEALSGGGGGGKGDKQVKSTQTRFIQETLERLKDFRKDELQILEENFRNQMALMKNEYDTQVQELKNAYKKKELTVKEYEERITQLTLAYEKARNLSTEKYNEDRKILLEKTVSGAQEVFDRLKQNDTPDLFNIDNIRQVFDESMALMMKAKAAEIEMAQDVYKTDLLFAKDNEKKKEEAEKKFAEKKQAIERKYRYYVNALVREERQNFMKFEDEKTEKLAMETEKRLRKEKEEALFYEEADNMKYENEMRTAEEREKQVITHTVNKINIELKYLESVISFNEELLNNENITAEERDKINEKLFDLKMKRLNLLIKKSAELNKAETKDEKKKWKEIVSYASQGADSLASIMGSVAELWQNDIKRRQEQGKISEEEAEKEFNRTKALSYGQTVLSTASAAMGAYNSLADIPYVGPVLGALAAAAAIAAGAVQLQTIANQKYGDMSGGGSGGNNPIVIPPQATYSETNVVNPTEQNSIDALNDSLKNQEITVKITDIEKVENRKKSTEAESSW